MKKFLIVNQKSFSDFGVKSVKELWEKAKKEFGGLSVEAKSVFTKTEGQDDRFHAVFSTASQDRHLEIVYQNFDLSAYARNPVYLDSHNYDSIARIIGKVENIGIKEGALQGDVVFCLDNPLGVMAQNMASKGFLNTSSIGFIPLEFDNEGNILRAEIIEISACSVPANPEALFDRKKADKEKAEGDECDMGDGEMGEMHPNGDGEMVCTPKSKKIKIAEAYKTPTAFKAAIKLNTEHKNLLVAIASNLSEIRPSNKGEKQRKIFKSLREAFK